MDGGWTAYGTSAQVTHGNSGGPVLDAQGRVLGLVSFASTDAKGNANGDAFFVPADVIRETLNKASVKPAAGTLTNLYYQALSQGDFRHYRHELAILSQVQTRSAWHAYVKDEVSTTQSAVLSGKDQTPPVLTGLVQPGLAGLGAATLLAISTLLGLWLRGRRRAKLEAVAAPSVAAEPTTNSQRPEVTAVPEVGAEEISAVPEEAATETIRIA
jgi:S1-C subfamily serine protease